MFSLTTSLLSSGSKFRSRRLGRSSIENAAGEQSRLRAWLSPACDQSPVVQQNEAEASQKGAPILHDQSRKDARWRLFRCSAISQRTEWTVGYDRIEIGGTDINSVFTGLRFRF